jgi:hypothetical protein
MASMSEMFKKATEFKKIAGELPIIAIAGGGQWALQYTKALHWFISQNKVKVVVFYHSKYGQEQRQYHRYLKNTLINIIEAEQLEITCIDLSRLTEDEDKILPSVIKPKAVFVVTPPETHCENAIYWSGNTNYIFIEKPFDVSLENVELLKNNQSAGTEVFGFDHYAARLKPFLNSKYFTDNGFGKCVQFEFEMFEAAPRGLEERAPSIKSGMLFDMASHALPVLSWLIENQNLANIRPINLYASTLVMPRSTKKYIDSETFGILNFDFPLAPELGGGTVLGQIRIGKGIGPADSKFVTLTDSDGKKLCLDQWFMLARSPKDELDPIHEKVIHLLVEKVIIGRPKDSGGVFDIGLGEAIVKTLISWTSKIREMIIDKEFVKTYENGMTWDKICEEISDERPRSHFIREFPTI